MDLYPCGRLLAMVCPITTGRTLILLGLVAGVVTAVLPATAPAQDQAFSTWLQELRAEASQRGIQAATLDAALRDVKVLPRVIELDGKQPEVTLTFAQYLQRVIPDTRVHTGRQLLKQHQTLLNQVAATYGVPAPVIVALWGIESDYGRRTGGFSVISALATLAYDGRRSAYFRRELLDALQILDEGHISPDQMTGSWAGAMGQSQFMPSSFINRAVDYNDDGRRDIWTTLGDVFASTANYLARAGWRKGQLWGREVKLPADFDTALAGLNIQKSLAAWQALGVRRANGHHLPTVDRQASII
ncbi:MAG: lytic murein transglycosylase, partial [Candidatus Tectomicrobia bacterium]|nr:lytic murein transglycosylase [Candidatus Tectomicrobia bacterium]